MADKNPYRKAAHGWSRIDPVAATAWDEGFAAGRAAATPDPPTGDPHDSAPWDDDWQEQEAMIGTALPAASPDERLREAAVIEAVAWSLFPDHPRPMSEAGLDCARRAIDTALFAAADREAPDEAGRICCRGMGADGGCNICAAEATR